ncbi:MAG: hypothetical protein ACPG6P_14340 [Akkermansiaceae bacterium]
MATPPKYFHLHLSPKVGVGVDEVEETLDKLAIDWVRYGAGVWFLLTELDTLRLYQGLALLVEDPDKSRQGNMLFFPIGDPPLSGYTGAKVWNWLGVKRTNY